MDASTCADTKIVIRDLHLYGDDLTVRDAIARLCGGTWVAVTVTDPAPPGGDPRSWTDITICRPAPPPGPNRRGWPAGATPPAPAPPAPPGTPKP